MIDCRSLNYFTVLLAMRDRGHEGGFQHLPWHVPAIDDR
jgi:hypothetical protein